MRSNPNRRGGFTLLELLVVIAVIAVLAALLMAGAQVAREAAYRVKCANNLRNLAQGCMLHHMEYGRLPTGGWGWNWVGDPDRGTDRYQTGGWGFCLLPYVEQGNIRNMGQGLPDAERNAIKAKAIAIPMSVYNCPSRRTGGPYHTNYRYRECDPAPKVARTDYAANCGDTNRNEFFGGPGSKAEGDDPNYGSWHWNATQAFNGPFYERSEIKFSDITRGPGYCFLLGEKYLNPNNYYNGSDGADNETLHTGMNNDVFRSSYAAPTRDRAGTTHHYFGSNHRTGLNMSYCDGSVKFIPYTINAQIFKESGRRN